jgi:hypothetical protein
MSYNRSVALFLRKMTFKALFNRKLVLKALETLKMSVYRNGST